MKHFQVALAAASLLLTGSVQAQVKGGVSRPAPTVPSPTSTTNNRNSSPIPSNGQNQTGIYVNGKVVVQDGSEMPMNVVLEKVCGSRVTALGYADRKGNFSVQLTGMGVTSSAASVVDASEDSPGAGTSNGGLGQRTSSSASPLIGCELRASSAGYRSDNLNLGSQRVLDNPNIGQIMIRRNAGSAGTTVSATMLNAPKDAVKAYERGMEAVRKGNADAALKNFTKAVEVHPSFAAAWYELGRLRNGDPQQAQADFEKALAADPKYVLPYVELASLSIQQKKYPEAIDIADRALRLDPVSFPGLYYFDAVAHFNLNQMDEAEAKARSAIKADVDRKMPRAMLLLAAVLERKGDLPGAAQQMHAYLEAAPNAADAPRTRTQLAAVEAKIAAPND